MNYFRRFFNVIFVFFVCIPVFLGIVNVHGNETITFTFQAHEEGVVYDGLDPVGIPDIQIHPKGVEIHHIDVPSDDVYSYAGWYYRDSENIEHRLKKYDIFNDDTTFYAKWVLTPRSVNYVLNGGTMANNPYVIYGNQSYELNPATMEGKKFVGWFDNPAFEGSPLTAIPKRSKSLTLYARFADATYTVSFLDYEDNVIGEVQTVAHGESAVAPSEDEVPIPVGHKFVGWDVDFSEVTNNLVIKAQYEKKTYTITYKIEGEEDVIRTYTFGADIDPFEPSAREGHEFSGWTPAVPQTMPAEDLVVAGLFIAIVYNIEYHLYKLPVNDPVIFNPLVETYTINSDDIILEIPDDRTSSLFVGWYLDENFDGDAIIKIEKGTTGNITLYAKWEPRIHTITFDANGGTPQPDSIQVEHSTKIKNMPVVTKDGYTFLGWFSDDEEITVDTEINKDMVLVALWSKVVLETYTVTFDSDGGSFVEPYEVFEGNKISKPTDPIKIGYEFLGWFIGEDEFDFNQTITKDLILVARWEEIYIAAVIEEEIGEVKAGIPTFVYVGSVANSDLGKLVRFHFTLPDDITLEYQEGGVGDWIALTNVFGPKEGFELGDITTKFRLTAKEAKVYNVLVEIIEVDTEEILAAKDIEFEVIDLDLPVVENAGFIVDNDGNLVFSLEAVGEGLYSLEIDHNFEKTTLPEFTLYALESNPFGSEDALDWAQSLDVEATYIDGVWKIILLKDGVAFNQILASSKSQLKFHYVISNVAGGETGSMDPTTPENTRTIAIHTVQVDEEVYRVFNGAIIEEPATPTKDGYEFLGWFIEEDEVEFPKLIIENITIVPKWEEIYITIAEARQVAVNEEVTVKGVVTGVDGRNVYLEDETAAIVIRFDGDLVNIHKSLKVGDLLTVEGVLGNYFNLVQIQVNNDDNVTLIESDHNLPPVLDVALLNDITDESMQGKRININDLIVVEKKQNGRELVVKDSAGNEITLRAQQSSGDINNHLNTAIVGQFVNLSNIHIGWFNDNAQLAPFALESVEFIPFTDEQLVGFAEDYLIEIYIDLVYYMGSEVPSFVTEYDGVTISWDLSQITDDGKWIDVADDTDFDVTVTLEKGEATQHLTFTITILFLEDHGDELLYLIDFEQERQLSYQRDGTTTLGVEEGLIWSIYTANQSSSGILWNYNSNEDLGIGTEQGENIARIHGKNLTSLTSEVIPFVTRFVLDAKFYGNRTDGIIKIFAKGAGDEDFVLIEQLDLESSFKTFHLIINKTNVEIKIEVTGERVNVDNLKIYGIDPEEYQVTFDPNNDTEEFVVTGYENIPVLRPNDPVREGYTFVEWQLDGVIYDFSTPITNDITLVAKWEINNYKLMLPEGVTSNQDNDDAIPYKTKVKLFDTAPEGFILGEFIVNDVNVTQDVIDDVYVISAMTFDIVVDIVFVEESIEFLEVTFDYQYSQIQNHILQVAQGLTINEPQEPVRPGYNFLGWFLDGEAFDFDAEVDIDIVLKARWEVSDNISFVETFEEIELSGSYTEGQFLSYDGTNFKYNQSRNHGNYPIDGSGLMLGSSSSAYLEMTFKNGLSYFSFQYRKAFTGATARKLEISFIANDGSTKSFEPEAFGSGSNADDTIYTFVEEDLEYRGPVTVKIKLNGNNMQTTINNIAWTIFVDYDGDEPATYDVTFDSNGGTLVDPQAVREGRSATEPEAPQKEGYIFDGWFIDDVEYDFTQKVKNNLTLVAKWIQITHSIDLPENVTSYQEDNEQIPFGSKVILTITVPEGQQLYNFTVNGIDETEFVISNNYEFEIESLTEDIIVEVEFIDEAAELFSVTFVFNDGVTPNEVVEVVKGGTLDEQVEPTRSGFDFLGWFAEEEEFSFDTVIDLDITLEARWIAYFIEDFEGAILGGSYSNTAFTGANDSNWQITSAVNNNTYAISGNSVILKNPKNDSSIMGTFENGIKYFSFEYRKAYTGAAARKYKVDVTHNRETITYDIPEFGKGTGAQDTIYSFYKELNLEGEVIIKIYAASDAQATFDNFKWTEPVNP